MATKKKLLQAAAGTAAAGGGGGLNVEEVFSTYLYTGNGSTQTITNGIDLSGEGGLVWHKARGQAFDHYLVDTERGGTKAIRSNLTNSEVVYSSNPFIQSFNANGFTQGQGNAGTNGSGYDYASWTFRKAPKFFDVVTYTGDGTEPSAWINHNLGTTPASIWIKRTDSTSNWFVYHKDLSGRYNSLYLNDTSAEQTTFVFDNTTNGITDTQFRVWFGGSNLANISGATYVAYLFAHNNGDGDFGPTGDQDIIKCGSYTGNGSSTGPEIDLGWEPQWLLYKNTSTGGSAWVVVDNMRGITTGGDDALLQAQSSGAELSSGYNYNDLQANGFKVTTTADGANTNGDTYIYIAIRRGPMAVPTDATDVFAMDFPGSSGSWTVSSGFPIDHVIYGERSGGNKWFNFDRVRGEAYTKPNLTNAEASYQANFDRMDGIVFPTTVGDFSDYINYMWRRAPSFCDIVAYDGENNTNQSVPHNLTVVPEMMWIKVRNTADNWGVYHKEVGYTQRLQLNSNVAAGTVGYFAATPTDTNFFVTNDLATGASGNNYVAYLFASVDGVSKVGSFTGDGTSGRQIDCGFSSGARFILIKATSTTGHWLLWDAERGIVTGNDPYLLLNDTSAENTAGDNVDPYSAGFIVNGPGNNASGVDYIFYAIA